MVSISFEVYEWFVFRVLPELANIQISEDFRGLIFLIFLILVPFLFFKFFFFVLDLCWRFVS